jgi:ABC-type metal ion transport system substrate-binding protein
MSIKCYSKNKSKRKPFVALTLIGGGILLGSFLTITSCSTDNTHSIKIICTENPHAKILNFAERLFNDDG